MDLDLQSILFLIGVQELGQGYRKFKKNEKMDLMHIAICTILEPFGYYMYAGKDADGWPHFDVKAEMPMLSTQDQERLMKSAVLDYFKGSEVV
ncbi:MAG: hypothetical protein AB8B53_09530 [Flavobacteriales bacterium]